MIYCVEDDDNIRELVIYTLETTGLKARGFADGSAFMEALAFDTPELILLDIIAPRRRRAGTVEETEILSEDQRDPGDHGDCKRFRVRQGGRPGFRSG